jgi:hypothetical protein
VAIIKRSYFISLDIILLLCLVPIFAFAQQAGAPVVRQYGLGSPFQISDLPPGELRWALESLPPQAKSRAMEKLHSFSFPYQDIEYLRVDKDGGIFYVESFVFNDSAADGAVSSEAPPALSFDPSKAFSLHSRPNAPNKVFLNFQGGVISGTAWSSTTLNAVPYDSDGNPAVFSDAERTVIADIWHSVAEDYAPFDIDVTTERPASFGPAVGHVMITRDTDANGANMPAEGSGGVAYVNVWGSSNYATKYSPAFVYYNNLGTSVAHYISEAASHEFGHNLSLSHDGTSTSGYYEGLGTGNVSWGPIMGAGYYTQVTQWSKGEYPDANNYEDDIAIIASKLTFRPDDHGNSMSSATMLAVDPYGIVWSSNPEDDPNNIYPENKGIIEQAADVDFFAFDHAGGAISFTVTPAWAAFTASMRGANLDIQATLYDSLGRVVASSDPLTDTYAALSVAAEGAGRYYLAITGVGNSVTPYSDYGSLGQYYINGEVTVETVSTPNTPSGPSTGIIGSSYVYTTGGSTSSLGHSVQYLFEWGDGSDTGWLPAGTTSASHGWSSVGSYSVRAYVRCATDTSVVSDWSGTNMVNITNAQHTLTVASSNPNSGVNITVSPTDNNGYGTGPTQFTLTYNDNAYVSLTAPSTASGNYFGSWGGCDISAGNTCYLRMNANRTVTAIYISPMISPIIRVEGGTTVGAYSIIQGVFNDANLTNGNMIKMHAVTFDESPNFNRPNTSVLLQGGYDSAFSSQLGMSTVHGTMTITGGTLTIQNLIIQ